MVSYDFGCIENDTIGFTNGKYTKNGGSNPTGVVVKLYSASSRYPQSLSDYTEIGSATAELMGINLTGTALKGAQYLFYGAGEERVFIASYYAYGELTSIQLTTNKNIISHADTEKATLTATIKDGDGEAIHLEDKLVTFYKQTIKSTQNSITIAGEDTTTLENSTNNNGDKITFTVTNPTAAIALLFDETKTVSLRNLATNDKITTEHINGTYKVYVNNTLIESWSTDTNYSKIEIINSDSTSFTVNNYTHYNLTSLGTAYTDGLGTASYEYSSAGVGDVVFYAGCEGIISSEIYVEDCTVFNPCTTNSIENVFNVPSTVKSSSIYGFNSDGWKFGNVSSYTSMSYNLTAPTIPFEVVFTMTELNSTGLTLVLGSSQFISVNSSGKLTISNTIVGDYELNKEYHAKVYSDKIELYKENTLIGSKTVSMSTIGLTLDTGSSRYIRLKNFKIKPL